MHKFLYKLKKIIKVLSLRELFVAVYHCNSVSSSKKCHFHSKNHMELKV